MELGFAQRYCVSIFPQSAQAPILNGTTWSAGAIYSAYQLPVIMRATPAIFISAPTDFALWGGGASATCTNISLAVGSPWAVEVLSQIAGGFTPGWSAWLRTATTAARFSLIARLP
jgi:hypothetical protein